MFKRLKESLYILFWAVPVFLIYGVSLLDGNFYSIGNLLLGLLISFVLIMGLNLFASSVYENIQEDVVSEISPNIRAFNSAIKFHIFAIIALALIYVVIGNPEFFIKTV